MTILFASDLHLSSTAPKTTELFLAFLERAATRAQALYLLGDIFEIWLGDDDDSQPHPEIIAALGKFTASGAKLYIMSGNRDFLLGDGFIRATGAKMLGDWHTIDLFGTTTLLTHGDLLCTRDVQYQAFRSYIRDPARQSEFLAHSLEQRRHIAANTRSGTKASMLEKDDDIMDVEQSTVAKTMANFNVERLIHGHTHRPAEHQFTAENGRACERWVLGDWYESCSVLEFSIDGPQRFGAQDFITENAPTV